MKRIVAGMLLLLVLTVAAAGPGARPILADHAGLRHLSALRIVNELPESARELSSRTAVGSLSPMRRANEDGATAIRVAGAVIDLRRSPMRIVNDYF